MRAQPTILPFGIATTSSGFASVELPPPALAHAAHALGSSTIDTPGGLVLGQPLVITERDSSGHVTAMNASLAAQTAATYLGTRVTPVDAWSARLGERIVPLDGDYSLLMLPFQTQQTIDIGGAGGPASRAGTTVNAASFFQSVAFTDALHFDDATLRAFAGGNVLVIGSTAQALGDFVNTPYGRFPGVFANMRMMDQLMRGEFIVRSAPWVDIALIAIIALLVGFVVTQLPAAAGVATGAAIVVVYSAGAIALYGYTLHWIDLIHVDAATILAALFVAMYRTVTEGADKRVIREMFGKHVSPAIVDHLLESDDPLKSLDLRGKSVRVTIFYSDIRGFTAMSENMTPEQIYSALNEYFAYGGYVDKFIGDCVMAVFSAPNPQPDDPYRAVRSAWDQQQRILEMMTDWAAEGRKVFTVGMGLNTGEVVMGNLGSVDRLNYTVIGDSVNTASRLEAERNRMVLHDINIIDTTRGITRIKADLAEANGPDLGNSDWVLTGHVQVFMPQGNLSADKATVQFVNKRIASMSAQGAPAEFEHHVDGTAQGLAPGDGANRGHGQVETARGRARQIDYDMEHDLLTLKGDSWLTDGCNEINSQSIVYDIANQSVRAEAVPGDAAQVYGTLHARSGTQCGSAAARP